MPTPQWTQWISHRGRCYEGVENTVAAFRDARKRGFSHFETDLRCSADGHIVLCHDANLRAVSDHPLADRPIHSLTLKTLKCIPLRDGQSLMTLSELLDEFSQYRWIFDIKPETAERTVDALIDYWWPSEYKWFLSHQVRFLFWSKKHQDYLTEKRRQVGLMAQLSECRAAGLACLSGLPFLGRLQDGMTYALPPSLHAINLFKKSIVDRYHQHNAKVLAFLPQGSEEIKLALSAGVDEILLDGVPLLSEKKELVLS